MSGEEESTINDTKQSETDETLPDEWLIRDCKLYKSEYKECRSIRGRFHQYFIFGELQDCRQWNKDYLNCYKWEDYRDIKAANAIIENEKARRETRLRAHYANDVWKTRDQPPAEWSKPLPDWLVERDKHSYLALKSQEMREGIKEETKSWCSFM